MKRDLKEIICQMTLEEKASLCSGANFWRTKAVERLGIPSVMLSDGPHGLRKQTEGGDHLGINESISAVCFPSACATASSFDTDLLYSIGETIGNECQAEDLGVVLGPAVNIKRSPLCGRNFEYFSEDPYLSGKLAAAYIRGVQSKDVGTSIKHFAANNQEYHRMSCSSEVSERALREIYFPAFEIAVKESRPWTIMCSYNKLNGVYAADNEWLLSKVLREQWGFEGYVVTDWGAVDDRVQGLRAGLELEMPGSNGANDKLIVEAVQSGRLDIEYLNQAVERILRIIFQYADHHSDHANTVFDREADHEIAVNAACECAVLLENNGILPLKAEQEVVYIGAFAKEPRYQGGGSSHINASRVSSALDSARSKGRKVRYVQGFPADRDELDEKALDEAVQAAKQADAAVIFAGLPDSFESEGYDRENMAMPIGQSRLIAAVAAVQPNTVVVLHNGSPVETPWAENTAAVLEMYLGGQGVGEAADRILYGDVNPSGHLAESFPYRLEDNPSYLFFPGDGKRVRYAEDVFVGYRYYESKKIPVRWAFGHGLSYTCFSMDNLRLSSDHLDDNGSVTVYVDITNIGERSGKEVVQLYISDRNGTCERPEKELKGFAKIHLNPGETKTVSFEINARSLSYWNESLGDWYAPSGSYRILIGDSSDHILCSADLSFTTGKLLPISIDGSTTLEELLGDPRTAPVAQMILAEFTGDLSSAEASAEEGQPSATQKMMESMILSLPLKSLPSFGDICLADIAQLIALMNSCLEDGTKSL